MPPISLDMAPTKNLKFLLLIILLVAAACTRKTSSETTTVTIQTPQFVPNSQKNVSVSQSPGVENLPWLGSISARADINCYVLFVGGPTAELSKNYCKSKDGQTVLMSFGPLLGGIPAGQSIELELPSGSDRTFFLLGMRANAGYCKNFLPDGPGYKQITYPRVLDSQTVSLSGTSATVSMSVPSNLSGLAEIGDCQVEGGGSSGESPESMALRNWGDGRDGSIVIAGGTANISLDSSLFSAVTNASFMAPTSTAKVISYRDQIISINTADSSQIQLRNAFTVNQLEVGDEVLWHFTAGWQNGGGPDSACGSGVYVGQWGTGRIVTANGATGALGLSQSLIMNGTANNTNIGKTVTPVGQSVSIDFCAVQLVRVPNFSSINVQAATMLNFNLNSVGFDYSSRTGGILPIRVQQLIVDGTLSADMSGRGFTSISYNKSGDGIFGQGLSASAVNNFNGGAYNGGGGANAGAGAVYTNPGGQYVDFCTGPCLIEQAFKMIFGGAGGSASANYGGYGGGALMLYAKEVSGVGLISLTADGTTGTGTNTGGGGGGSLLVKYGKKLSALAINASAKGGNSPTGGVGGGGSIDVWSCANSPYSGVTTNVNFGASGTSTGAGNGITANSVLNTLLCP